MRRELPLKPNLEHLKSQAKDLLDAHRRGDPEALSRIRAAVPAFANKSDEAIAAGPFALHDAQSAIAREYGHASWAELREHVAAAQSASPEVALMTALGVPLPPELLAAVNKAMEQRSIGLDAPTPATVPVLPVRNAVVFPGSMIPLHISRPSSLRALDHALAAEPAFIAVFAQRAFETESPGGDDLHPNGCLCIVRFLHRDEHTDSGDADPASTPRRLAWTIVQGVRWVTLEALEQAEPYHVARIANVSVDRGDASAATAADHRLRETARKFADTMGSLRERALAAIDGAKDTAQLADLVMSNLAGSVADKAAYAEEPSLLRRLDLVIAALDVALAAAQAAQATPA